MSVRKVNEVLQLVHGHHHELVRVGDGVGVNAIGAVRLRHLRVL